MVEGVTIGSGGHSGSSSSSHSSSSSSSSKNRDTRILIRVSPLVQAERIHSFFDRSLSLAKPPIGCGFVKKVQRKSGDKVIISIEDASIARRLVSSFSDSRSKIDGHEFTIELYSCDHSKSLCSPSNINGDKKKEKESTRMSSCQSESSPSTSTKKEYHSSSRPSTSTNDSMRNECLPSSSSSIPIDPYEGIVAVAMHKLPFMCESIIKEILSAGLREIGGYLDHFTDDSGRMKVLLKRTILLEGTPSDESITVQGEEITYTTLPSDETRKLYDRYLASSKSHSSIPSTSSSSSSSYPSRCPSNRDVFSYNSSRTIFLPCLTKGTTKEFIRKRFHKIGEVLKAEVKNINSVSPHAIVEFAHSQAAVMAMEDYEREQKDEGGKNPLRNRKRPYFIPSSPSLRVWVANLPSYEEDYVKKKLMEMIKGAQNATVVVDTRRREGIIDFASQDVAKHYLEVLKSSPIMQQNGQVQTWLVADFCSEDLYTHFRDRRGVCPISKEVEMVSILSKRIISDSHREEANVRMEKLRGGDEKPAEKKNSINGENGNDGHSPSSSRRSNAEDRRSGDSGFSEDRDKLLALDSDDDEVLEAKWTKAAIPIDRSGENGKLRERLMKMGDAMEEFYKTLPQKEKKVKKEVEEEGRENSEKMKRDDKINYFRDALLNVSTPLKARPIEEMGSYRGNPLRSPPIPISPLNGDRRHTVRSPPSGSRPAPLHINIPPSTSIAHSNTNHSPYTRLPSTSSRHPSISTPSTLTPRSQTMPSTINRPPFPIETNGDHGWNNVIGGGMGINVGTPTSSRIPLSRRESVCSNSSQSHTPLPPSIPSTSNTGYTPTPLKSPPVTSWSANAWKPSSLSSPNPSSINRSRPSIDSHHKPSTPLISRPGLPKIDKPGYGHGSSSSLPKTPSLPRSSSMNEKKPNISRESSKDIVTNFIQNKNGPDMKKMPRIPKKENRERDEKDERREKKREEKDRERREERKEKKEDRKKSRENESKEEKAKRKELKRKEREKEERKKSMNEKEKKRKNMESEKKKKKKQSRTLSDSADSDFDSDDSIFKVGSSSKQMADDEALARSLAGSSMYDRVKVRRSGSNREEKKKIDALEAIRKKKKKEMKTKKRAHLSSSSESEGEIKESGKKIKKEEEEESSEEEEEKERRMKEKKREKKREKERRETSDESDSDDEREKKRKKKEKKVSKKNSLLDLFSDDADSVKSEKKEKLSKKRSHDRDDSPSTSHPPPGKKVKKEETSSSASESEGERSSKKSEVSISSRTRDDKIRRLSESSVATEKDESWKSPASGSVEKEIKEEPKEDRHPPRLMTKAAMKEFGGGPSSSPAQFNIDETGRSLVLSSEDSSQSSSDSDDDKEEREERKEDEENREEEERNDEVKMEEENEEKNENEKEEKEGEKEEEVIEEKKEDEIMEEEKDEEGEMRMEMDDNHSIEKDDEAESAVRGLESPTDEVIEETEKAVESIFDEEEEPEARYPSNDFLNPSDMNLSSSSSQCSSPKIPLSSSLLHRPTPIHPHSIPSPSILSPSPIHSHILQSHSIPPSISSPLISPSNNLISPSGSRPSSIHQYQVRPISQESSSQHLHDDNGGIIHQEKTWTSHGSSSDGFSPSPNHHPTMNKEEIIRKFPLKWNGRIGIKKSEVTTQWLKLHGDDDLLNSVFPPFDSVTKITGKFRMDNDSVQGLLNSMDRTEDNACLVVTPAGKTLDEVRDNRELFTKNLVNFFTEKVVAGITEFTHRNGQTYIGHYFAPGPFVADYLSPKYPDFLDLLNTKYADAFLLVLLKRKEE